MVDDKAICASACALAFLGGRDVNGKSTRTKFTAASVGYHAFTRDFNENVSYSAADLKTVLHRTQIEVFNIAEYLRSIETNMDVLRIMLSAPPQRDELHLRRRRDRARHPRLGCEAQQAGRSGAGARAARQGAR